MAIELVKRGTRIDLTKGTNITKLHVGLGWDTNRYNGGHDFDLDVSVFMVDDTGKVRDDADFIFYNNLKHTTGAIEHTGDNRTGEGDGDDEVVKVDFARMPAHIHKLAFVVTIHDAVRRSQNFGQVLNAFVRVDNDETGESLVQFDLGEDFSVETGVVVCEIYKHNGDWKFNAIGAGYSEGLAGFVRDYGLQVG